MTTKWKIHLRKALHIPHACDLEKGEHELSVEGSDEIGFSGLVDGEVLVDGHSNKREAREDLMKWFEGEIEGGD